MPPDLCAIVPAYNCESSIAWVVAGLRGQVETIVVVDDGSQDKTTDAARHAGAQVETLARNRGKGFALRRGIELGLARGPRALALLDGDGQHDPADLPSLIEVFDAGRADLVIGSRWAELEKIPPHRYWTNYIGSRALSWMTGLELTDSQSGFRLLSASLAGKLQLRAEGYAIESEMLIKAARHRARVAYAPIRAIYSESPSHFRPVLDTFFISCASIYFKVFDDP